MKEEKEKSKQEINNVSLTKEDLDIYQHNSDILHGLKVDMVNRRKEFELKNCLIIKAITDLTKRLNDERNQFSDLAFIEYKHTGNKKLIGGLGIRIGTNLNYDTKTALNWATEHNMCLTLDKKNFDKIAKTQEMDFVKKEEIISVTFPKEIKFDEVD